ncbi:unnamed protein product [Clonostachys rosea]|uniref:Uncharacterized protein n=1 Tax=Bionectria ochroleuca TaxID=29856 RepID=A0ABY6UX64_BIOOC|nr:unnamed protein product [Clonostachys rosea]
MLPSPCFMALPMEVRLPIYRILFQRPGGLVYDHQSHRLRFKDGQGKLDLSFTETCRAIAADAQGMPFELNTITFTAGCDEENYGHAEKYSRTVSELHSQRFKVLTHMGPAISDDIYDQVTLRFPLFKPVLDAIREHQPSEGRDDKRFISRVSRWGDIPFSAREAVALTCRLALQSRQRETVDAVARYRQNHPELPPQDDPLSILTLGQLPWEVPSKERLGYIQDCLYELPREVPEILRRKQKPFHFSAAAVAAQLLGQLPHKLRMQLGNIVLREDTKSVAFPACHARGLIPLCQENPDIRIERRVSLFGNVLMVGEGFYPEDFRAISDLSKSLAVWAVEAMDLEPAGMPPETFQVVLADSIPDRPKVHFMLDDHHTPKTARVAFDKAFQRSLTLHLYREGIYESSDKNKTDFFQMTRDKMYMLDGFPRAMKKLFQNNGMLRCSFSPGELGEDGSVPPGSTSAQGPAEDAYDSDDPGYQTDSFEVRPIINAQNPDYINIVDDLGYNKRKVTRVYSERTGEVFGHTEFPGILC